METIVNTVYKCIVNNNLIVPGDRVLVSVSAGKDSMALLHILFVLRARLDCTIAIYHLDHAVRGDESFDDLLFVIQQAARYGIGAFVERYDFNQHKEKGKSFEEQAREYRYARLKTVAHEYGYTKIATAHTCDDQVETLIMRIFQGTGLQGLQAIPLINTTIIRPLLLLHADDVYAYCTYNELSYRHDSTNDDTHYLRNFIRHEVIPLVKKRFTTFDKALLNLQQQALGAVKSIEQLMAKIYPDCIKQGDNHVEVLEDALSLNEYLFKFYCASIISNYLHRYCDTAMLDALYRAHVSGKKNVTLFEGNGIFVYRRVKQSGAVLLFCYDPIMGDSNYEYTIPLGKNVYIDELGLTIQCSVTEPTDAIPYTESKTIVLRYTGYSNIVVRNRRSGDTIFRKAGKRTLKRLYIDYKLTPEQKQKLPIIVIDNCVAVILFDTIISKKPEISQTFLTLPHEKMLVIHYWYNHND